MKGRQEMKKDKGETSPSRRDVLQTAAAAGVAAA
jgi:hypothetical protein